MAGIKIDDQYTVFEGSQGSHRDFVLTYKTIPLPHAHHHCGRVGNKSDGVKCVCLLLLMTGISLFLLVMCGALMAMHAWPRPTLSSSTRQEESITILLDEDPDTMVFTCMSSGSYIVMWSSSDYLQPLDLVSWQEEGILAASSMEEHCSPFDPFCDDVWSSSGNSHTRARPTLSWSTWLEAKTPTVSPIEKHWRLTVSRGDVLSSSGNSLTRPPSIENNNPYRAEIPEFIPRRKADAEHGKNTSIFSLPFYSDYLGYKICYWLGMQFGRSLTTRQKYRFILLEWGWYFEKH